MATTMNETVPSAEFQLFDESRFDDWLAANERRGGVEWWDTPARQQVGSVMDYLPSNPQYQDWALRQPGLNPATTYQVNTPQQPTTGPPVTGSGQPTGAMPGEAQVAARANTGPLQQFPTGEVVPDNLRFADQQYLGVQGQRDARANRDRLAQLDSESAAFRLDWDIAEQAANEADQLASELLASRHSRDRLGTAHLGQGSYFLRDMERRDQRRDFDAAVAARARQRDLDAFMHAELYNPQTGFLYQQQAQAYADDQEDLGLLYQSAVRRRREIVGDPFGEDTYLFGLPGS